MKNVTLSVDERLLQASREYAHNQHTSLNNLIRKLLQNTASRRSNLWVEECLSLMDRCKVSSRGKKWSREDLYDV
jgi:hypothetical protein